jgi:hypothetical protein
MGLIFLSYSHADEEWRKKVELHLRVLRSRVELEVWSDPEIGVGENWGDRIRGVIDRTTIAIVLISADSLCSDYINNEELPLLLQRRRDGGLRIIPIIIRPCAWTEISWLKDIQVWPKDAKPLSTMGGSDAEESLASFTKGLVGIVDPSTRPLPRETIKAYVEEQSNRIWRSYVRKKGLFYWDLEALPIEFTKNPSRQRDGHEIPSGDLWKQGKRLILLLGPPACGKTTYCRRLQARPHESLVPVDIGPNLPCTAEEAIKLFGQKADIDGDSFLRTIEAEGNLVFIADGIGEKRVTQRILESLDRLAVALPNSRFLVTCRTGDWPDDKTWLPEFDKWFILDLDQEGWNAFWKKQIRELERRMREAFEGQPQLRRLCQNQFLFLIAAKVLAREEGAIPKLTRVELYDRFLDGLLADLEELTPIARAAIVSCLENLAVEMRKAGDDRTRLPHGRVQAFLRPWLPPGASQNVLEEALSHLYHIGLVEESMGGIRFFQEHFQEYLCAKWLTARLGGFPNDDEIWSFCQEIFEFLKPGGELRRDGDENSRTFGST